MADTNQAQALADALFVLAEAEATYRKNHDLHGDGSREAGRAWDMMRRAGDKARAALASYDAGSQKMDPVTVEACAKVAADWMKDSAFTGDCATQAEQETGTKIAAAIRSLGSQS